MFQNPLTQILPPDQANLVLVMIVSIPLSYLLSLIYNKYLFLTLSMSLTIGFQSYLFPNDKWVLWIQQQVIYLLVIFSPRKYVGNIVIIECFTVLVLMHLRRLYLYYGQNPFDITGIFMMQLFNYIGLAYNYQNGALPENQLSKDQIKRRVIQKPSYITYLGYVNFLPSCLVGPVYQFADYQHYLNRTGDFQSIPSTINPALKQAGVFIIAIAMYACSSFFPLQSIAEPFFGDYNFFYKLLYCVLCITHIELKYIAAWSMGMISMRASGFTYNPSKNKKGPDGTIQQYDFGRVEVNNMTKFYLDPNFKVKVDYWNISVQWALKRYIYQNFYQADKYTDEKKRKRAQATAQLYTIMVSALWHGIYPGYFVSFLHWIQFIQIENQFFRQKKSEGSAVQKFFSKHPSVYNTIENILSTFHMTFLGVPFHLMVWSKIWMFFKNTEFWPFIVLYISFGLICGVGVLGKAKKRAPQKDKTQQEMESKKKE